jgi:hypothetical protein
MQTLRFATLAALALLAAAADAAPADTTILIDQAAALAGGVTSNDSAGFPVTLGKPGHYKLAGNLTAPAGVSAILVAADDVTIDLNGFTVASPSQCAVGTSSDLGAKVVCQNGEGVGIGMQGNRAGSPPYSRLSVRNGHVRGFGTGIAGQLQLSDVTVKQCSTGISASEGSLLGRVSVTDSTLGISAYGSIVETATLSVVETGIRTYGSLLERVAIRFAATGVAQVTGKPASGLRHTLISAKLPTSGNPVLFD